MNVIREGDSGAPISIPNETGEGWCGMIIGTDGYEGYAMFAQTVQSWWTDEGYHLRF